MGAYSLDRQFSNYWTQLTVAQKQSTIAFIRSFYEEDKEAKVDSSELQEPEAGYYVPWQIFKPLSKQQKKALIAFLQSSGIEPAGRISIEQYNKELDEAMEEVKKGEVYSHAEVVKMAKNW